jgi:hypothetical protein
MSIFDGIGDYQKVLFKKAVDEAIKVKGNIG